MHDFSDAKHALVEELNSTSLIPNEKCGEETRSRMIERTATVLPISHTTTSGGRFPTQRSHGTAIP